MQYTAVYDELMRIIVVIGAFLILNAAAQTPAGRLWADLKIKRESLPGFHQEFDVSQIYKTSGGIQSSKRQLILDVSQRQWRERSVAGSGNHVKIFDGKDIFWMEEEGDEYVRTKEPPKQMLSAYSFIDSDWQKAVERERKPCGILGIEHQCVVLEIPVKQWMRLAPSGDYPSRMVEGTQRIVLDLETGLLMSSRTVEVIDRGRSAYQSDTTYQLRLLSYGALADA